MSVGGGRIRVIINRVGGDRYLEGGSAREVDTATRPRVAAKYPPHCENGSLEKPLHLYGFNRVGGTTRVVLAARAQNWGDHQLIAPNQFCGEPLQRIHGLAAFPDAVQIARLRSRASSSLDAVAAAGWARTTTRVPPGRSLTLSRTKWRNLRCTRCRTTDPPTALETTNPTKAGSSVRPNLRCTDTVPPLPRRP